MTMEGICGWRQVWRQLWRLMPCKKIAPHQPFQALQPITQDGDQGDIRLGHGIVVQIFGPNPFQALALA